MWPGSRAYLGAIVVLMVGLVVLLAPSAPAAAQPATATFDPPAVAVDPPAPAPGTPDGSAPSPTETSSSGSPSSSSSSSPSAPSRTDSAFPSLSQDQANGLFDGFLTHGFENATDGIRGGLQRLVDDTNLVTTTAPDWTYQQSTVAALQRAVQAMSNVLLALVIFWMGLDLILHAHLGDTRLEAREVVPQLVLGAGLSNSAAHWTALAIDFNNAACAQLFSASDGSLTDPFGHIPTFDRTWLIALLVAFPAGWRQRRALGGAGRSATATPSQSGRQALQGVAHGEASRIRRAPFTTHR